MIIKDLKKAFEGLQIRKKSMNLRSQKAAIDNHSKMMLAKESTDK
jgi:hypothetical protein